MEKKSEGLVDPDRRKSLGERNVVHLGLEFKVEVGQGRCVW